MKGNAYIIPKLNIGALVQVRGNKRLELVEKVFTGAYFKKAGPSTEKTG